MRIGNNYIQALKTSLERLPVRSSKNEAITLRIRLHRNLGQLPENVVLAARGNAVVLDFSLGYESLKVFEDGFSVSMMFRGEMTHMDILWSAIAAWDEDEPPISSPLVSDNVVFVDFKNRKKAASS